MATHRPSYLVPRAAGRILVFLIVYLLILTFMPAVSAHGAAPASVSVQTMLAQGADIAPRKAAAAAILAVLGLVAAGGRQAR